MSFIPFQPDDAFSREAINAAFQALDGAVDELRAADVKVQTGSYTGTGVAGSGNQTVLNFTFDPALVVVKDQDAEYMQIFVRGCKSGIGKGSGSSISDWSTATWTTNKLSFYSSSAQPQNQLNVSGRIYRFVAIG